MTKISKTKIVLLPLDERPCNYYYPKALLSDDNIDIELVLPPKNILGDKKIAADFEKVKAFLIANIATADALVISIDTLLYGGIVPSRLHNMSENQLASRLQILDELKVLNPNVKIYAFSLIMRCPQYSSDDEEPSYYQICGKEIFKLGEALHKQELGLLSEEEILQIADYQKVTQAYLSDYLDRRTTNTNINCKVVDKLGSSIDFLIIPQDDSSVYGFIARDQQKVRNHVKASNNQMRALIYPGADEVGLTLLSRAITMSKAVSKTVAVCYSSTLGSSIIPLYEDRMVGESIKYHIIAAGGILVEDSLNADIVLMVNTPSSKMTSANMSAQVGKEYNIERSLPEFVTKINYLVSKGKNVAIADIAYVNGGDNELVIMLESLGLTFKVGGYAGWNTSSNTLGTTIAQSMLYSIYGNTKTHSRFLALRYFEDIGYCANVRKHMCDNVLESLGFNYFDAGEKSGKVANIVQTELTNKINFLLPSVSSNYKIDSCYMPWSRMFEVGIEVSENKPQK